MKRILLFILIMGLGTMWLPAQNATSSPSSRFGYGELNDNLPNSYRGMGGVGLAMRSNKAINPAQPASYTSCDSLTFMFDFAGSLLYTNYSDSYGARNKINGNLEYVTLQFPIWKQWIACSAGVMPYSAIGYGFTSSDSINSDYHYTRTYEGSGGFAQVYFGLSFNIANWLALGANAYYMFGDETQMRTLSFTESLNTIIQADYLTLKSWRFRYGAQLFHTFTDHAFVLGAIFETKQKFNNSLYMQVESTTLDTVCTLKDAFSLPMTWGVGISYTYADRLTLACDYSNQDWHNTIYFNQSAFLKNRYRIAAGVEYRHNPVSRSYAQRMLWRAGFTYSSPYTSEASRPDLGASIGIGFPLRTVGTIINTTVEYTHRGSGSLELNENSVRLIINASIAENWFFKRKL